MDGQPVWVENKSNPYLNGWGIMLENICSAYHGIFDVEEYGKTWLAYAYPPVHIDIEAWEACEFCKRADFGEFGFEISKHYAKISCALASWRFPKEEQFSYCPKCGKPLSEEAWQELEKRVRGEK